jgi:membrane protease YdiL (CAAX protease family)
MSFMKKYPLSFSLLLISSIILLNRIPLSNIIQHYGLDEFNSDTIENIIFNFIVILGIIFLILKNRIPVSFIDSNNLINTFYYLPLILYLIIFSSGLSSFLDFKFSESTYFKTTLFSLKTFSSAFLEEILFRGIILGLLLYKFNKKNMAFIKVYLFQVFYLEVSILSTYGQYQAQHSKVFPIKFMQHYA